MRSVFLITLLCTKLLVHTGFIQSAPLKPVYIVGASPIWGVDRLFEEFNATFERFLTEEVGTLFDPPISFKMVAVDTDQWHTGAEMLQHKKVDFIYTGAAMMSCHQSVLQVT